MTLLCGGLPALFAEGAEIRVWTFLHSGDNLLRQFLFLYSSQVEIYCSLQNVMYTMQYYWQKIGFSGGSRWEATMKKVWKLLFHIFCKYLWKMFYWLYLSKISYKPLFQPLLYCVGGKVVNLTTSKSILSSNCDDD